MALHRVGHERIMRGIGAQVDFRHGNVRGEWCYAQRGQMPASVPLPSGWHYVVYSYATPIAWFDGATWEVPCVRYSATTSNHQAAVRQAISAAWSAASFRHCDPRHAWQPSTPHVLASD
jgi:hypothetical protein